MGAPPAPPRLVDGDRARHRGRRDRRASFQASQWSEAQADAQAAAAIARTDASRSATAATTDQIIDTQTWLAWVDAVRNGDTLKAEFLEGRFSDPLSTAQEAWLVGTEVDENGVPRLIPDGTPMDLPTYVVPAQVQSDADAAQAEAKLAEAAEAGATATNFVLLAVILALVLFFASIATKFSQPRAQVLLGVVAVLILVVGLARLATLPHLL